MDQEVVGLLREIKFVLYVLLAGVALTLGLSAIRFWRRIKPDYKSALRKVFQMQAEEHFEKGELQALIAHCNEKLREYPSHSHALWYLGKAHFALQDFDKAKAFFEKLKFISPEWGDGYTLQMLDAIAREQERLRGPK